MAVRQLPERTNRGKRTKELIGEEKDMDELFWKTNGLYVDEVDDEDYEKEPEKEDKFDADFWKSESSSSASASNDDSPRSPRALKPKPPTRKAPKATKRLKLSTHLSQRELLEEAAGTEMWNQYRLTQMMQFEEAKTQRLGVVGRKALGPAWKTVDTMRGGKRKVIVRCPADKPLQFVSPAEKPERLGKYKDPKTGKPYNTIDEFRKIRMEYANQQEADLQARIKSLKEAISKKRESLDQSDSKIGT
jgi:hypothetical protein